MVFDCFRNQCFFSNGLDELTDKEPNKLNSELVSNIYFISKDQYTLSIFK